MRNYYKLLGCIPLVVLLLIWSGCGDDGNEDTDTASSVYFEIISVDESGMYHGTGTSNKPLFGDIVDSNLGGTYADYIEMVLLHNFKGSQDQDYTGYTSINIYAYSVYYERSQHDQDLGGTEVPSPLERIAVSYTVPTEIVDDDDKKLNIIVTTIQQKFEPPLSYLYDESGVEPSTGLSQIQVNAFITLYAKDGSGNELQPKTGQIVINYANYNNEE